MFSKEENAKPQLEFYENNDVLSEFISHGVRPMDTIERKRETNFVTHRPNSRKSYLP